MVSATPFAASGPTYVSPCASLPKNYWKTKMNLLIPLGLMRVKFAVLIRPYDMCLFSVSMLLVPFELLSFNDKVFVVLVVTTKSNVY